MEENIDVILCHCSVYDECWAANMSDVMKRARGEQVPNREEKKVVRCTAMEEIGI